MEDFEAQCPDDHVIVMTEAKFGQMKLGRCLDVDVGHLGCHGDVIDVMDAHCSGKRECSVELGSQEVVSKSNCAKSLMQYLEADYTCVRGLYQVYQQTKKKLLRSPC